MSKERKVYTLSEEDYNYLKEQAERYKQTLEYIQREIRKAIYTPKKQKWNSDFEKEFEKGQIIGLIQASNIVDKAIRKVEGEE